MTTSKRVLLDKEALKLAEYELARYNYADYVRLVHEGRWKKSRFGRFLCDEIQAFVEHPTDRPYDILVVSVPPQHGKSMTITETLPSWYLGKNPYHRVIEISYNVEFAKQFGRKNRDKIKYFGKQVFGVELAVRPNSALEFELSNHVGSMISRGLGSGVTGRGCNLMIIDDPVKNRKEADSKTTRNWVWSEWQDSFKSRLAAGAKVIVIQTRWHEDDLAGRIIETEPGVKVLNLPCEAEENDPMGRSPGEPLHPEINKGAAWLKSFKESVKKTEGTRTWEALYQGHPTVDEGNIIKREWWRFYDENEVPENLFKVISIDSSFKDTDRSDFTAIQVWGKQEANYYLLERVKARMDFVSTMNKLKYLRYAHPTTVGILVEDKANGPAVVSMLKNSVPGVIAVNPQGGKMARLNAVAGVIEAGNVYLPREADWIDEFIDEFAAFPNGAHDDEVDCCSQALNRLVYTYTHIEPPKEEDLEQLRPRKQIFGVPVNIRGLFR